MRVASLVIWLLHHFTLSVSLVLSWSACMKQWRSCVLSMPGPSCLLRRSLLHHVFLPPLFFANAGGLQRWCERRRLRGDLCCACMCDLRILVLWQQLAVLFRSRRRFYPKTSVPGGGPDHPVNFKSIDSTFTWASTFLLQLEKHFGVGVVCKKLRSWRWLLSSCFSGVGCAELVAASMMTKLALWVWCVWCMERKRFCKPLILFCS